MSIQNLTFDIDTTVDLSDHGIARPLPSAMGPDGSNERLTVRTSKDFVATIDALVEAGVFDNRSEVFRLGAERLVEETVDEIRDGESR